MGTASAIGTAASIIAFGVGLYLGVNAPFPWPIAWALGITAGVALSFVTSLTFELIDHRKRYGLNFVGTHVTHDVEDGCTITDCYSCSGADRDGYRVSWAKDDVFLGMVRRRYGGGYSYYCSTCHEDAIEAGLRAGREHEFRERYQGEDHYTEVLEGLRKSFLDSDDLADAEVDFWAWVEMLMDYTDDLKDSTDPRTYDNTPLGILRDSAHDEENEPIEGSPVAASDGTELEGLPDEFY